MKYILHKTGINSNSLNLLLSNKSQALVSIHLLLVPVLTALIDTLFPEGRLQEFNTIMLHYKILSNRRMI